MTQPSNPPAFPIPNATDMDGYVFAPEAQGMSLRDWFAGQALVGMGMWEPSPQGGYPLGPIDRTAQQQRRAEWAYQQADAMLAERERQP